MPHENVPAWKENYASSRRENPGIKNELETNPNVAEVFDTDQTTFR